GAALLLSSNLPSIGSNAVTTLLVIAAVATGTGHGLSYWGANREIDLLTPTKNRAGISAALYLAFYAGAGAPAVIVGLLALSMPLVTAAMIFTLALLLATIVSIPVPRLAPTVVRQSAAASAPAPDVARGPVRGVDRYGTPVSSGESVPRGGAASVVETQRPIDFGSCRESRARS